MRLLLVVAALLRWIALLLRVASVRRLLLLLLVVHVRVLLVVASLVRVATAAAVILLLLLALRRVAALVCGLRLLRCAVGWGLVLFVRHCCGGLRLFYSRVVLRCDAMRWNAIDDDG